MVFNKILNNCYFDIKQIFGDYWTQKNNTNRFVKEEQNTNASKYNTNTWLQ